MHLPEAMMLYLMTNRMLFVLFFGFVPRPCGLKLASTSHLALNNGRTTCVPLCRPARVTLCCDCCPLYASFAGDSCLVSVVPP